MTEKGPAAFRSISEASAEVGVPSHVLRFWETRFSFIRPMKRAGGRRFYRPHDLQVLRGVRSLLHDEGYTIKGVQKLHKEGGLGRLVEAAPTAVDAVQGAGAAAPTPVAPSMSESDGPPDLFADRAAAPAAEPGPLLGDAARRRLDAILTDLETVKTRIDALLPR